MKTSNAALAGLILTLLTGCASQLAMNRTAAAAVLACPEAQVLPVNSGERLFEGCGKEAECVEGMCRRHRSTNEIVATIAAAFQTQFNCPIINQKLTERSTDYVAQGCGRNATCSFEGRCREYLDRPAQLSHAREAFNRETGCPIADISIVQTESGFRADGCQRAANCATYDGPCIAIHLPSCGEIAQRRYDSCMAAAHQDGKEARDNGWNSRIALAGSIQGTLMETKGTEDCRDHYNQELSLCGSRQAGH